MKKFELHHTGYQITPNSLEIVLELFEKLDCSISYKEVVQARWAMITQKGKNVNIQLFEKNRRPLPTESKIHTHVAFLSKDPISDIRLIEKWAKDKGIKFVTGGWNEKERWFDLPEIFIDFVIEVMDVKVVE